MRQQHQKLKNRRRAFLSMELVLTLPILMMLLFGLFEFCLLFYARGTVVEASRNGARAATHPGATWEHVEESVLLSLGPVLGKRAVVEAELADHAGEPVTVVVRVPMKDAAPDLLWPIGFSLQGRELISDCVMRRE